MKMIAIQDIHCTSSAGVQTIKVALCFSSRGGGLAMQSARVVTVLPRPMPSAFEVSRSEILFKIAGGKWTY